MKHGTQFFKTMHVPPARKGLKRSEFSRGLRLEPLEQRRLLSVDLEMRLFDTDPDSFDLQVRYRVFGVLTGKHTRYLSDNRGACKTCLLLEDT